MKTGVTVNVEEKMPQEMIEVLNRFEFQCIMKQKKSATTEEIEAFIKERSGIELALKFRPEFMNLPQEV